MQKVVHACVEQFIGYAPHAEGVTLVGGYLVHCVETDVGGACGQHHAAVGSMGACR